jgi:subtilisin-like proprotein convertase family protein
MGKYVRNLQKIIFFAALAAAQSLSGQTFNTGPVNKPIPNNLSSIYLPLSVSGLPSGINGSFGVESVCLDLAHTSVNNLEIYLTAPDGTGVQLSTKNGGDGDGFTGTCFHMTAPTSILRGTAPFTGNFRPEGDFGGVNNGQNPNGVWALIIIDVKPNDLDSGVFNNWSITFSNTPAKPLDFSSDLPIISINTNGQFIADDPKKIVDMGIVYNGPGKRNNLNGTRTFTGKIAIEIRGSSSQQFPKRSYSFETRDLNGNKLDTSLLGMPREHDWVLYAPYSDKSLIRNAIAYQLFAEMGHYSVRFRLVELVINRQYQGVYMLTEKIKRDKSRINIAKLTENDYSGSDLTGGYIFKIDRVNGKGGEGWYSSYKVNTNPTYFQFEYPNQDSMLAVQKQYIKNYVDSFETTLMSSTFNDPYKGYRKYIDVNSFVDNMILNEVSRNTDGYRLSTFLHKNKSTKNGKLINGPIWDFDIAWYNCDGNGGNDPSGWQFMMNNSVYETPFWWGRFMQDTMFTNDLYCRYTNFRKTCLSVQRIYAIIDSLSSLVSEAQVRNFNQWPILGTKVFYNPEPVPTTYKGEIDNIKNFLAQRLIWLDANIQGKCAPRMGFTGLKNEKNDLKIFPNPFMTTLYLSYKLYELSKVHVRIYNTAGAMVRSFDFGEKTTGNYHESIDMGGLSTGTYILKLSLGEQVYKQKLIKSN